VPLEQAICETAADLHARGIRDFHGYELAKRLSEMADEKLLTAYGTLYRALGRLESMGLLSSEWEAPELAARESRPGRRLYRLTALGENAARHVRAREDANLKRLRRRLAQA
jgi:DNA-binding PadR family transcriptional regulator